MEINHENLYQLYWIDRLPMEKIGQIFGFSKDMARWWIRKFDIPARPRKGLSALTKARTRIKRWIDDSSQSQVILGSLLGDGTLSNPKRQGGNCQSHLRILHSSKQLEYLEWKHSILSSISYPIHRLDVLDGVRYYFNTASHPAFTTLRHLWYPEGKKIVCWGDIIHMDSLGLAIWYMDDGCHAISRGSHSGLLCSEGFSIQDQILLIDTLEQNFHISATLVKAPSHNPENKRIRISVKGFKVLCEIIRPHIIPSMLYKLDC